MPVEHSTEKEEGEKKKSPILTEPSDSSRGDQNLGQEACREKQVYA